MKVIQALIAVIAILTGTKPAVICLIWVLLFSVKTLPYIIVLGANIMFWGINNLSLK